jgi:predicted Zn-dependent protease
MRHPLRHLLWLLCALTLLALGCQTPQPPAGGRTVLLSEDDAVAEGAAPEEEEKKKKAPPQKAPILVTRGDDARVGSEVSKQVEAEIGLVDDPALAAYVQELGSRLARAVPRASNYQFRVVDQVEPNAFALPGGFIFISRGLLALANSEDELANVIGHEITHSARRHSAQQQALSRDQGFSMPWIKAGHMAAYGRDMEREADKGGQQIAAALGYDPMGMSTFLASLAQSERLMRGYSRRSSFFDTHPGTRERAAVNAVRAREIHWQPDPSRGDTHVAYLSRIDGLALAERPEAGMFLGRRFIHPTLDFQLLFPAGWPTSNTGRAVGAQERSGDAVVYLEGAPPAPSLEEASQEVFDDAPDGSQQLSSQAFKIPGFDAWRLEFTFSPPGQRIRAMVTLIDAGELSYRITGMVKGRAEERHRSSLVAVPRTFRRLSPEQMANIHVTRVRLVEARSGERLVDLSQRSDNSWSPADTAVLNGRKANETFQGGELVKIARDELWTPE